MKSSKETAAHGAPETMEAILKVVNNRTAQLAAEAEAHIRDHWDKVIKHNKTQPPDKRSRLVPTVRKDKQGGVGLIWTHIKWWTKKSEGKGAIAHRKPLIKGRTCFYSMSTLRKLSQPWEAEWVEELELRLAEMRLELSHLGNVRKAARAVGRTPHDFARYVVSRGASGGEEGEGEGNEE